MAWTIRTAMPDDIPAVVDVLNAVLPSAEQTTEALLRFEDGMLRSDEAFTRLVTLKSDRAVTRDVPHPEGAPEFTMEDFQQFAQMPGFRPEGLFVLTDGERFVGLSGVMTVEGRPGYTYFTGVDREYRGRGLATLLKLATIEFVQGLGIAAMRTTNDTVNYPMVAVNEKLGYRRLPARVAMKRSIGGG